ncbi:hypothetical protein DESA109040_07555 [Deinococcus saxicola]|uniref:hypothetical protein n=1 Tax=Deinococcus saxicola TaxID=249406 RepID=UPI0039F14116
MTIGVGLMLLTFVFGYLEIMDRWIMLWSQVQKAYQVRTGAELDLIDYLTDCLPKASCREAYGNATGFPPLALIGLHTNFLIGLIFAVSSRFWKPERWYRRQARVASARMINWFEESNVKPKGTLAPKRVGVS